MRECNKARKRNKGVCVGKKEKFSLAGHMIVYVVNLKESTCIANIYQLKLLNQKTIPRINESNKFVDKHLYKTKTEF